MKRTCAALLCSLLLLLGALPPAAALEGESFRAADTLAALGLVETADTEADYRLTEPASRAQAVQLLVRLAGGEEAAQTAPAAGFTDVPAWAAPYVAYAAGQGWIGGVAEGVFAPDRTVTANAWFAMLLRMLGYRDSAGDFSVPEAAVFARRIGLAARDYTGAMTLGDVYESIRDALTASYRAEDATVIGRLVERGACSRAAASALGLLAPELTARQAADRCTAAVFCLDLYETQTQIDLGLPGSSASGFFITADGLAVTNYHSIEGGVRATATLVTGEQYPVETVLWYDPEIDLAVIRVSRTSLLGKTTSAFACLELAGAADLRPGDAVYAISNPLGAGLAVSEGVVSAVGREVESYELPCILSTADISRGSSGGALLNVYGQAVAVTTGAYTYGNSMYLAVPADPVREADLAAHSWTLRQVAERENALGD